MIALMAKDILQQIHQQSWGFPMDADVAAQLEADSIREGRKAAIQRLKDMGLPVPPILETEEEPHLP